MRRDCYGLVQEILLQFKHLSNAGEQSERRVEKDENSSHLLDLVSLRDLLTCKEGDSDPDSSGLDVLAMAVIQCHQGINTLLVKTISSLPELFPSDHTYHGVASCTVFVGEEDTDKEKSTDEPDKLHYRKKVCDDLVDCFPNLSAWLKLDHASNMCTDDEQNQTEKGSRTRVFDLDPQTEPEIYMWMLTSPFLPFSEYLILDYCCNWRKRETLLSRSTPFIARFFPRDPSHNIYVAIPDEMDEVVEILAEVDLFRYLLGISDTRRRVLHHAVLNSVRALRESEIHPFVDRLRFDKSYLNRMPDSSGRIVGHLLVAVDPPFLRTGSRYGSALFYAPNWDPLGREFWAYDGLQCSIKLGLVHRGNAYPYYRQDHVSPEDRSLTLAQIIYTSPYLTETGRKTWLHFPQVAPFGEPGRDTVNSLRPSVYAGVTRDLFLTPLILSVLMGSNTDVKKLAQDDYDVARIKNQQALTMTRNFDSCRLEEGDLFSSVYPYENKSALQFAAERADPGMLRSILGTGRFNTHYEDVRGNTLLHSTALCEATTFFPLMLTDLLEVPEYSSDKLPGMERSLKAKDQQREKEERRQGVKRLQEGLDIWKTVKMLEVPELLYSSDNLRGMERSEAKDQQSEKEERRQLESRRQGCVNLLLQEGLDIWETNKMGEIADSGPKASPDYSSWWYEKLTRETQDQKASFSGAATAISVTAALVATASYVGPLQPPLGYSSEDVDQIAKAQAGVLPVRVFFVCNTLAFYLAVAAVVLSLTPSIPMPHESTMEGLKRTRRSVTWALLLLIIALVAVPSAFASASVVVIPNGEKWNYGGLTASGVVIGCIVCIAVLILCCARAVKLVFHNNETVDRFYRRWVSL